MKKKALIIATVGRFYNFLRSDISILQKMGYEVHCATNMCMSALDAMEDFDVKRHQIDFARNPFAATNVRAFFQLKRLLRGSRFALIHVHTPMGSILGRLAAKACRVKGTKIFYTAHGLHFYAGAPLKNWLLYFPAEWICSFWTDVLITINREDYANAKKHLHPKHVRYIPGVGVDIAKFSEVRTDVSAVRQSLAIREDEIMLLTVGEISRRKNQKAVVAALAELGIENIVYVICGEGTEKEALDADIREAGLKRQVRFTGHRDDVGALYRAADLFVLPSYQEGVSMALMEAVACKTPVLCSRIRGSVDVIGDDTLMFDPDKPYELAALLRGKLFGDEKPSAVADRAQLAIRMRASVAENYRSLAAFDIRRTAKCMRKIYACGLRGAVR